MMVMRRLMPLVFTAFALCLGCAGNSRPQPQSVPTTGETTVISGVLGPEGPLYIDGNLYYVAWNSDTLSRWDGKKITVLNHTSGCSHNGLALTTQRTFLIACDAVKGAIIETTMSGKQL